MPNFADYQLEIYFRGLTGERPEIPVAFAELEARARTALPPDVWSYVAGVAGNEFSQNANVTAFDRYGLIPRMLAGAVERDLSIELFGMRLPSLTLIAPICVI